VDLTAPQDGTSDLRQYGVRITRKIMTTVATGSYRAVFLEKRLELHLQDDKVIYTQHIQGVPGGKDLTSGEYSLGQTIPI